MRITRIRGANFRWLRGKLMLPGLLVLIGATFTWAATRITDDPLEVDDAAPAMSIKRWHNTDTPLSLEKLRGRVVLLDFWGVWCAPCLKAIPKLKQLAKDFEDDAFEIIMVHTPMKSHEVESFIKKQKLKLPIAIDKGEAKTIAGETNLAYRVTAYPSYFLIDKRGKLRLVYADRLPDKDVIQDLLDE